MKLRNTLILVVIFALLAGYVYFFEMKKAEEGEQEEGPKTTHVFDLVADDVVELTVKGPEGTTRLSREGQPWKIEEPIQEEADDVRINSLVNRLARLTASRTLTETGDLATYGLAEPQLTAELETKDNQVETLLAGDKNPQGSSYYVQKEGDENVYLVYANTVDDLKRLITELPRKPTPTPTFTPTASITVTATATPTITPTP
ncbi:MAG: DUF4340 domain-containing protein [Anaerolineae bacterium]